MLMLSFLMTLRHKCNLPTPTSRRRGVTSRDGSATCCVTSPRTVCPFTLRYNGVWGHLLVVLIISCPARWFLSKPHVNICRDCRWTNLPHWWFFKTCYLMCTISLVYTAIYFISHLNVCMSEWCTFSSAERSHNFVFSHLLNITLVTHAHCVCCMCRHLCVITFPFLNFS